MSRPAPAFVKITGSGRYQIKPYALSGWLIMAAWTLAMAALVLLMLLNEWLLQRWWIVMMAEMTATLLLVVFAAKTAVPVEDLKR